MRPPSILQPPRPRTLIHPGHVDPVRILSLQSAQGRHIRLTLNAGQRLFDAIVAPLADQGITSASMTILGGWFDELSYCVAPPDPKRNAVIAYGPPISAGRAYMIFGNATLGRSMKQAPLVHCHAAFVTESGEVKGGHILTEASVIGARSIAGLVTSLDEFELLQSYDAETNIALLKPTQPRTS